ncbi:MAG: hypothetical protein WCI18_16885 [Pseudomonadota bacterium]
MKKEPIELRWQGGLAECAVGQSLLAQNESHDRLHYWLRKGKTANAAVDYVVQSETHTTISNHYSPPIRPLGNSSLADSSHRPSIRA